MLKFDVFQNDRVDKFLRKQVFSGSEFLSRKAWKELFSKGFILNQDNQKLKAGDNLSTGDKVKVKLKSEELTLQKSEQLAQIIHFSSTRNWAVYFKSSGIASYPIFPWEKNCFANQIAAQMEAVDLLSAKDFADLSPAPILEGGLVQRLDTFTSGLMLVALDLPTKSRLQDEIKAHRLRKSYHAIVHGKFTEAQELERELFSKSASMVGVRDAQADSRVYLNKLDPDKSLGFARVHIVPLAHSEKHSLIEINTHSGLRHQVRVLLAAIGFPLEGDLQYLPPALQTQLDIDQKGHLLHAYSLQSISEMFPELNNGIIAAPPKHFLDTLANLGLEHSY